MDPTPPQLSLDTTSLEDLVALAQAQGIHLEDETDRDHIVDLLKVSIAADEASPPSPPPPRAAAAAAASNFDSSGSSGGIRSADLAGLKGVLSGADLSAMSPPFSPMSFGSPAPPAASAPPPQRLSDILAMGGMQRPHGDTSSSVGAEAGSRGRGGGGSAYGGGGGGGGGGGSGGGGGGSGRGSGAGGNDSDREVDGDDIGAFSGSSHSAAAAAAAGTSAGDSAEGAGDTLPQDKREALETFMAVTQAGSRATATQFLVATDWSPDAAINLFLESGGDAAAAAAVAPAPRRGAAQGSSNAGGARRSGGGGALGWPEDGDWDGVEDQSDADAEDMAGLRDHLSSHTAAAAAAAAAARNRGHAVPFPDMVGGGSAAGQERRGGGGGGSGGGSPGEQDPLYPGGFSEDGVRAPIPTRRDRLIGGTGGIMAGGGGGGAMLGGMLRGVMAGAGDADGVGRGGSLEEKDNTDWIFTIPEGLSFPSAFLETRQICKEQKKWLMVNIQDHEEFASHRLNKDVWSNETILTLLRGNFVFWQRNKTLRQARYYIEKYNLEGQVLPHTAILDPRTGAQLLKVVGFVEPEDLSMALVEFLENNSIDQVKAPALKTIGLGNIAHHAYNETPGKDGGVSERTSPDNSVGAFGGGRGSGGGGVAGGGDASFTRDSAYESFGSEEYVYEDDDDAGQGSSFDGDNSLANSYASPGSHSNANTTASSPAATRSPTPTPTTTAAAAASARSTPSHPSAGGGSGGGGEGGSRSTAGRASGVAAAGAGGAGLLGPWGRGTPEDQLRAEEAAAAAAAAEGEGEAGGMGGVRKEEVPPEPDAGNGVTQVLFRMAGGGTVARRFWLTDRVSLLFQFVRSTGEEASRRPFDLLSGHPPTSLLGSKVSTLEAANLSNSAIMVRWL